LVSNFVGWRRSWWRVWLHRLHDWPHDIFNMLPYNIASFVGKPLTYDLFRDDSSLSFGPSPHENCPANQAQQGNNGQN
jgi:hypothetical protein